MSTAVDLTNMTQAEMVERIQELEAFRDEWQPVLIMALQSLVAATRQPMFQVMGFALPPQLKALIERVEG